MENVIIVVAFLTTVGVLVLFVVLIRLIQDVNDAFRTQNDINELVIERTNDLYTWTDEHDQLHDQPEPDAHGEAGPSAYAVHPDDYLK